jgi:hypothetical protein
LSQLNSSYFIPSMKPKSMTPLLDLTGLSRQKTSREDVNEKGGS